MSRVRRCGDVGLQREQVAPVVAQLQQVIFQDLSRGSNVVTSPYVVGKQQSVLLTNCLLDEHASLRTRDGVKLESTSPDVAPVLRAIVRLFDFVQPDGSIIPLVILRGISPGNNALYRRDTNPWTLLGILGTDYAIPDMLAFVSRVLIANGYEVPWQFSLAGGLSHLADTPGTGSLVTGAKHHTLHQGFYWVWNTAETSGTASKASLTTALGTANADLVFTAVVAGAGGNAITVEYANDGANITLTVSVLGNDITVHLATDGGGTPVSTAAQISTAVNLFPAAAALVLAANATANNGSGVPPVMVPTGLTGGGSSSADFDGPTSLRSSDLNNPNSWPLANQIFVDKDDGDPGMGMGQFTIAESGISPTTSQILFKQFKAYQMTGVFGSTNPAFTIQKVKTDMGCIAPRTIAFAPGFGLIRLTHRGFALFDGVDDKLISEEVRPLIFGNSIYAALDWTTIDKSYAAVVANPPLYLAACPLAGDGLTRLFVYDLVRRAWALFQYPMAIATMSLHLHPGAPPHLLLGDFADGQIQHTFAGDRDDNGIPISCQALLHPVSGSSPQTNSYFRRAVLKVTDVVEGQDIDCLFIVGPVTSNPPRQIQKTVTVPVTVGLGLGWGLQPWGTSPYGGLQINSEADLTVDLGVIGTNLRPQFTWAGPLRLRGVEYHQRQKPLRRVSVFG